MKLLLQLIRNPFIGIALLLSDTIYGFRQSVDRNWASRPDRFTEVRAC